MDVDMAEAIVRVEIGSSVSGMSSKEIKRDLLLFAKRNPALFLDLANDENVQLRNFAIYSFVTLQLKQKKQTLSNFLKTRECSRGHRMTKNL
jgi:hypothetical protein